MELKYLYAFTNHQHAIVEIKQLDLPEAASLSDRYKWLLIHLSSNKVLEFDFKSMSKTETAEFRSFVEGELEFNESDAQLKLLGQELKLQKVNLPSGEIMKAIEDYLGSSLPSGYRWLKPSDISHFERWLIDPEVIRYSATIFHRFKSQSDVATWFFSTLQRQDTFQFGILDPVTNELIGQAGIAVINEVDQNGEYFILIGKKSAWGKGIATRTTLETVKLGFDQLKLHRIFLTASSENPGAIKAYVKAGFKEEGRMREAFFRNQHFSDKVFMGILRSEY